MNVVLLQITKITTTKLNMTVCYSVYCIYFESMFVLKALII